MSEEEVQTDAGATTTVSDGDWRTLVPEDLRNDPTIQNIKAETTDEALSIMSKQFVHAQRMTGRDKVVLPTDKSTPEELNEFYTKLGRPGAAEEYEVPTEGMPENVPLSEEAINQFKNEAFEMGISKQNAARLIRFQANMTNAQLEAQKEAQQQEIQVGLEGLKKEYGVAYDQNVQLALQGVNQFGDENFKALLNKTGVGDRAEFIRVFAKVGKALASDEILGEGSGRKFALSPEDASRAIGDKKLDPNFMEAYKNDRHPGHEDAQKQMAALYSSLHPETGA